MYTWLESNNTTKWSDGLRFIQFMKNRTYLSLGNKYSYRRKARNNILNYNENQVDSNIQYAKETKTSISNIDTHNNMDYAI